MSGLVPDPIDELIEREASALRDMTIPDGPSQSIVARTLTALDSESRGPAPYMFWRNRTMFMALKIAAALLVTAGGLTFLVRPNRAAESFAEVAAKLRDAQTLSYRMTMQAPGRDKPETSRMFFKAPGWVRSEAEPSGGPAAVLDTVHGKALITDPTARTAIVLASPPMNRGDKPDIATKSILDLRQLADKQGEPAGEKQIGTIQARGFRVHENGLDLTVWIDPQAKLPLIIEFREKFGETTLQSELSDIQIDPKLDESLFSLEPPAGYTVQNAATKVATVVDGVVKMLRIYAEANDGAFPARLDDVPGFQKAVAARAKATPKTGGELQAEAFEIAQSMGMMLAVAHSQKDRYVYHPQDVKPGDAKAIVFAYKPDGSETWKAVYGDFHVADVAADQLPGKAEP
jgi:outer membrane lipoprotein-sorting protein